MGLTNNLGRLSDALTADGSLNVGVGASPNASYKFDVTGAGRYQDNLLVSKNQNASTNANISNTTSGTAGQSQLILTSDATAGSGNLSKKSNTFTTSGIINLADLVLQNSTKGDIAILNSFATGTIKFAAGGSSTAQLTIAANGNITQSVNQNAGTSITVSNTTSGTSSQVDFIATSDASAGSMQTGKYSTTKTAYKIIASKDAYLYNGTIGGDISILNDFATGTIKFAAGGSTTAQLTIAANGTITQSVNQNNSTILNVSNTTSGTASEASLRATSDASAGLAAFGKYSTTRSANKIITAQNTYIYNGTAGDIAILNDFASGTIKFAAGGSSTAQAVIKTTGQLQLNNYTSSSSFTGTSVASLGVDASGNVITTSASSSLTTLDVYLIKEAYK